MYGAPMKKVVIPAILAATVLIAGIFALMPIQKASTIHSSFGGLANTAVNNAMTTTVVPAINSVNTNINNTRAEILDNIDDMENNQNNIADALCDHITTGDVWNPNTGQCE